MESQGVASEDPAIKPGSRTRIQEPEGMQKTKEIRPPNQHELRASELTETRAPCTGPARVLRINIMASCLVFYGTPDSVN